MDAQDAIRSQTGPGSGGPVAPDRQCVAHRTAVAIQQDDFTPAIDQRQRVAQRLEGGAARPATQPFCPEQRAIRVVGKQRAASGAACVQEEAFMLLDEEIRHFCLI